MSSTAHLVDLHCHLLPGLDDGPTSWVESAAMARCAVADGVRGIVATPHQLGPYTENTPARIRETTRALQGYLAAQRIDIPVFPGAEARLEPEMVRRVRAGDVMTLADAGRHVLVELPHEIYVPWDNELLELRRAELVAVFAHPERNQGVRRQPEVLAPLVAQGCLLQVTAGSLLGKFGGAVQKLAERLIDGELVHLVASDGHGSHSRAPLLAAAHQRIAVLWGTAAADRLCCENPSRIVDGKDVLAVRGVKTRGFRRALFTRWAAA